MSKNNLTEIATSTNMVIQENLSKLYDRLKLLKTNLIDNDDTEYENFYNRINFYFTTIINELKLNYIESIKSIEKREKKLKKENLDLKRLKKIYESDIIKLIMENMILKIENKNLEEKNLLNSSHLNISSSQSDSIYKGKININKEIMRIKKSAEKRTRNNTSKHKLSMNIINPNSSSSNNNINVNVNLTNINNATNSNSNNQNNLVDDIIKTEMNNKKNSNLKIRKKLQGGILNINNLNTLNSNISNNIRTIQHNNSSISNMMNNELKVSNSNIDIYKNKNNNVVQNYNNFLTNANIINSNMSKQQKGYLEINNSSNSIYANSNSNISPYRCNRNLNLQKHRQQYRSYTNDINHLNNLKSSNNIEINNINVNKFNSCEKNMANCPSHSIGKDKHLQNKEKNQYNNNLNLENNLSLENLNGNNNNNCAKAINNNKFNINYIDKVYKGMGLNLNHIPNNKNLSRHKYGNNMQAYSNIIYNKRKGNNSINKSINNANVNFTNDVEKYKKNLMNQINYNISNNIKKSNISEY